MFLHHITRVLNYADLSSSSPCGGKQSTHFEANDENWEAQLMDCSDWCMCFSHVISQVLELGKGKHWKITNRWSDDHHWLLVGRAWRRGFEYRVLLESISISECVSNSCTPTQARGKWWVTLKNETCVSTRSPRAIKHTYASFRIAHREEIHELIFTH